MQISLIETLDTKHCFSELLNMILLLILITNSCFNCNSLRYFSFLSELANRGMEIRGKKKDRYSKRGHNGRLL